MERDGRGILYKPTTNFAAGNLDVVREMIAAPHTLLGLGDGGAHVGIMCDATATSYMLGRDGEQALQRSREHVLSLALLLHPLRVDGGGPRLGDLLEDTGLVRGVNNTTAATHTNGAAVTPSQ